MRKYLLLITLGVLAIGCEKENNPNSASDKNVIVDGCIYTQNIGGRSYDSTMASISVDSNLTTFTDKYLSVSLYEYLPYLADASACLVEIKTIKVSHNNGTTIINTLNFKYLRSDSLRYYFDASLFEDSLQSHNNRIMYSNPDTSNLFFAKKDTVNIKLIVL